MLFLVLCGLSGLFLITAGVLLIWKGKIQFDERSGRVTEIKLPWWGGLTLTGLTPALVLFVLGCALVVIPVVYEYQQPHAHVTGEVATTDGTTLLVYVAVDPAVIEGQATHFSLSVPFNSAVSAYDVLYVTNKQVLSHLRVPAPVAAGATVKVQKTVELQ